METISIRDLRGADLEERAREGRPLAITNHRALIGVIIPASSGWLEHLVFYNWSRIRHSIAEGEQALAEATAESPAGRPAERDVSARPRDAGPGGPSLPLAAAVMGETVVQTPESREALEELRAMLNPAGLAGRPRRRPGRAFRGAPHPDR